MNSEPSFILFTLTTYVVFGSAKIAGSNTNKQEMREEFLIEPLQ